MSAIACDEGMIIGTIERANSCQSGFSSATVLSAFGTEPRRTVPARSSNRRVTPGAPRNPTTLPKYAGERLLRKTLESSVS